MEGYATPSLPQVSSETAIAERFAPWRDVPFEALEAKKPILKPFTATLPWHWQRGEDTMLSLSEAAKTAGVSKSTIWRACKAGRVSFKRTDTGEFQIDAAELHRVFPFRLFACPDRSVRFSIAQKLRVLCVSYHPSI